MVTIAILLKQGVEVVKKIWFGVKESLLFLLYKGFYLKVLYILKIILSSKFICFIYNILRTKIYQPMIDKWSLKLMSKTYHKYLQMSKH